MEYITDETTAYNRIETTPNNSADVKYSFFFSSGCSFGKTKTESKIEQDTTQNMIVEYVMINVVLPYSSGESQFV